MPGITVPRRIRVLKHETGAIEEMDLDEYLQGVVLAEMGASYPLEALKAQAIAARSFALAARKHGLVAHVCTDHRHCQAWKPDLAPLPAQAVKETQGQVICFGDRIVTPFYFGHCDGRTRDFEEVWVAPSAVPYCRGVPCICGHTQLWGHGVGMCQEGARAMAERGATAEEVLRHYYTGIAIAAPALMWTMQVEVRPGPRAIAGDLARSGIPVTVSDPWGNRWVTASGDKPEHGVGGFEVLVWFDTTYTVSFLDQEFPVEVDGTFKFLAFEEVGAPPVEEARLVSRWMTRSEARAWLDRFEGYVLYRGRFTLEEGAPGEAGVGTRWTVDVETCPGPRAIAGDLARSGIPVTISDPWGNHWTVTSGDKPEHGVGGFEVLLWFDTTYIVRFLDQEFPVEMDNTFKFLTFTPDAGDRVRLVSDWLPEAKAQKWHTRFESLVTYRGLFDLEKR